MLHAIEEDAVISSDGKLPEAFREAFGRRARVIVLLPELMEDATSANQANMLMSLAGKIDAFKTVADPVAWQRSLRDEWTRDWEQ
ncbi:MAG: hypothetical protein HZA20_08370 [Nitrospirae bacterium]|jgi:hypothetical protein|nr:hypothetical protein [Nitrospirota bacterium]